MAILTTQGSDAPPLDNLVDENNDPLTDDLPSSGGGGDMIVFTTMMSLLFAVVLTGVM